MTAFVVAAPPAAAAASVTTAYWWQPEPVTGLIAVPGVPDGGMYVASSSSGPQAISAMRITGGFVAGLVRVTLHVAQRQVVNAPTIAAYHVTSSWQPGGPQPWSSKPTYDARRALARGRFDIAQTVMSLDLPAAALSSGVVLAPAPTPGASVEGTFAIAFDAPASRDVRAVRGPPPHPSRPGHPPHSPSPSHAPSHSRSHSPSPHTSSPPTGHRHHGKATPSSSPTRGRGGHPRSARPTTPPPGRPDANAATGEAVRDRSELLLVVGVAIGAFGLGAAGAWQVRRRRSAKQ